MKFCPVIVSVKADPPVVEEFGLREMMAGTGLDGGGGGFPPVLSDPPAPLPPQPFKKGNRNTEEKKTHRGTLIGPVRRILVTIPCDLPLLS